MLRHTHHNFSASMWHAKLWLAQSTIRRRNSPKEVGLSQIKLLWVDVHARDPNEASRELLTTAWSRRSACSIIPACRSQMWRRPWASTILLTSRGCSGDRTASRPRSTARPPYQSRSARGPLAAVRDFLSPRFAGGVSPRHQDWRGRTSDCVEINGSASLCAAESRRLQQYRDGPQAN